MSTALEALKAAVEAAHPGAIAPKLVFYRVVRTVADRFSLQKVFEADGVPDVVPIDNWPGVAGWAYTPTPGELVIVAFVGVDLRPCIIAHAPLGESGHTPVSSLVDATAELKLLTKATSSAAKCTVGAVPLALAHGAPVASFKTAVQAFAAATMVSTDPTLAAAASALNEALTAITITQTTKLEAT